MRGDRGYNKASPIKMRIGIPGHIIAVQSVSNSRALLTNRSMAITTIARDWHRETQKQAQVPESVYSTATNPPKIPTPVRNSKAARVESQKRVVSDSLYHNRYLRINPEARN